MKIKLTRAIGGHKNGDTIDIGRGAARHLIDAGAATEVQSKKPTAKSKTKRGVGDDSPSPQVGTTAG